MADCENERLTIKTRQSFGEGVTEIQTTPTVTHLSFSDRRQAELFYNGFKGGRIPGINDDGTAVEVSWVSGPAAALPGSTTSSVNTTGGGGGGGEGLDSAMDDADHRDEEEEDGKNGAQQGETHTHEQQGQQSQQQQQQQQQQHQQQESSEANKEVVDYDVAGENEWDE